MAIVRRTLEQIRRMKPKTDRRKINRTTDTDFRRHMIEDGQSHEGNLSNFAPVIPPQILRKHLEMTQSEFAKALRIPLSTLRNWEQGRVLPDPAARQKSQDRTQGTRGVVPQRESRPTRRLIASALGSKCSAQQMTGVTIWAVLAAGQQSRGAHSQGAGRCHQSRVFEDEMGGRASNGRPRVRPTPTRGQPTVAGQRYAASTSSEARKTRTLRPSKSRRTATRSRSSMPS
jgi:putative transcriptional regulator